MVFGRYCRNIAHRQLPKCLYLLGVLPCGQLVMELTFNRQWGAQHQFTEFITPAVNGVDKIRPSQQMHVPMSVSRLQDMSIIPAWFSHAFRSRGADLIEIEQGQPAPETHICFDAVQLEAGKSPVQIPGCIQSGPKWRLFDLWAALHRCRGIGGGEEVTRGIRNSAGPYGCKINPEFLYPLLSQPAHLHKASTCPPVRTC